MMHLAFTWDLFGYSLKDGSTSCRQSCRTGPMRFMLLLFFSLLAFFPAGDPSVARFPTGHAHNSGLPHSAHGAPPLSCAVQHRLARRAAQRGLSEVQDACQKDGFRPHGFPRHSDPCALARLASKQPVLGHASAWSPKASIVPPQPGLGPHLLGQRGDATSMACGGKVVAASAGMAVSHMPACGPACERRSAWALGDKAGNSSTAKAGKLRLPVAASSAG